MTDFAELERGLLDGTDEERENGLELKGDLEHGRDHGREEPTGLLTDEICGEPPAVEIVSVLTDAHLENPGAYLGPGVSECKRRRKGCTPDNIFAILFIIFLLGVPLFSLVSALFGIWSSHSYVARGNFHASADTEFECWRSVVIVVLVATSREKPGDAAGDFIGFVCFPITICLTPVFFLSLAYEFL